MRWRKENPDKAREALKKSAKTLAKNNWVSYPQKRLHELLKQDYPGAILNMPIITNCGVRFGDIVLPEHNIVVEYDGQRWHQDKDKELQRDLELQFSGFTVLHFTKHDWEKAPKQIEKLLLNHANKYEFIEIV